MTDRAEMLQELSRRFVEALKKATEAGRATWFYPGGDLEEEVYCFVNNELIAFSLHDGTDENSSPRTATQGIGADFRNCSFLWLRDMENWDTIRGLVKQAKLDPDARGRLVLATAGTFVVEFEST